MFLIVDSMDMDSLRPGMERQCGTKTPTDTEKVEIPTCDSLKVVHLLDAAAALERQYRTETPIESEKVDGSTHANPRVVHLPSPMDVSSLFLPSNVVDAAELGLRNLSSSEHSRDNDLSSIQAITDYVYAVNLASNENQDDAKYLCNFGKVLVIEESDVSRLLGDGCTSFRAAAGEMTRLNST